MHIFINKDFRLCYTTRRGLTRSGHNRGQAYLQKISGIKDTNVMNLFPALLLGNHQVREITRRLARQSAFIQSATYFAGKFNDESDSLTQQQRAELWAGISTILVCREIRAFASLPAVSIIWRNVCWAAQKAILPASFSAIREITSGE